MTLPEERQDGRGKYLVSNAPGNTPIQAMLRAAFARWHVEKWFERAKQLAGFEDFEVRKYLGLMRQPNDRVRL